MAGLFKQLSRTGAYERRLLTIQILLIIAVNWMSIAVMVIVPDVKFGTKASNLTFDCNAVENSTIEEIIFDHSQFDFTATERYGLICKKAWLKNLVKTVYMLGCIFGAFTSGIVSDRYGRRPVMLTVPILASAVSVVAIFARDIEFYLFLRFAIGAVDLVMLTTVVILCTEFFPADGRFLVAMVANISFDLTKALAGASGYLIRDFRHQHTFYSITFAVITIISYFFTQESPRWLAANNKKDYCRRVIKHIADYNGKWPEHYHYLKNVGKTQTRRSTLFDIIRTPTIRKRTLILFMLWIGTVFSNYAILLNFNSFTDDIRLGLVIMGLISMPANFPILSSTNIIGRQICLFALWTLTIGLLFAMIPLAHDKTSPVLMALAVLGSVTVGGVFAIIYMYSQELYPTVIRQSGLGACSTMGRVAGLVAPQISLLNAYWPPATAVILGSVATVAALLVPALPDTTCVELAQTIDEGEAFLKGHRYALVLPKRRLRVLRVESARPSIEEDTTTEQDREEDSDS